MITARYQHSTSGQEGFVLGHFVDTSPRSPGAAVLGLVGRRAMAAPCWDRQPRGRRVTTPAETTRPEADRRCRASSPMHARTTPEPRQPESKPGSCMAGGVRATDHAPPAGRADTREEIRDWRSQRSSPVRPSGRRCRIRARRRARHRQALTRSHPALMSPHLRRQPVTGNSLHELRPNRGACALTIRRWAEANHVERQGGRISQRIIDQFEAQEDARRR